MTEIHFDFVLIQNLSKNGGGPRADILGIQIKALRLAGGVGGQFGHCLPCRFHVSEQRLKTRPGNMKCLQENCHERYLLVRRSTTKQKTTVVLGKSTKRVVSLIQKFVIIYFSSRFSSVGGEVINYRGVQPKCCCATKCSDYSDLPGARCPPHHFDCDPARRIPYCVPMGVPVYCRPDCSHCGVSKVPCITRGSGAPCGQCVRLEDATKNCLDQKWKALCDVEGTIKCATTDNCVLPQWILDGKDDCGDGSDEEPCRLVECATPSTLDLETTAPETTETTTTTTRKRPTLRTSTTTATTTTKALTQPLEISATCEFGQFRCMSGECVDGAQVLDGVKDCFDSSDEKYCELLLVECPAEAPCSYQPDIAAFGCGCGQGTTRNAKGICQPE